MYMQKIVYNISGAINNYYNGTHGKEHEERPNLAKSCEQPVAQDHEKQR